MQERVRNYPKSRTSSKKWGEKKTLTCCVYNLEFNSSTPVTDVGKNKMCRRSERRMYARCTRTAQSKCHGAVRSLAEAAGNHQSFDSCLLYLLTFSVLPRGLSVAPDHLWSCAKSKRAGLSALAFHCSSLHIPGADSQADSPLQYSAGGVYSASEVWLAFLLTRTVMDSNSFPFEVLDL